ncbi:mandelate racemase/muconate lactonizing enzyme family protein [Variovorax sp. 2RAF20]
MKITDYSLRPCTQRLRDANWKFSRAAVPDLQAHVLTLADDAGHTGHGYAHAIPSISGAGEGVLAALRMLAPTLIGRGLDEIAAIVESCDRQLAFNVSAKAAIDMALHDLMAHRLGVPVHVLLGGRHHDVIRQSRIVPVKAPAQMGTHAAELTAQGYRQLKLKLSGDTQTDVQRIASVRDAVGAEVVLTLDPNQAYSAKTMMAAFARMERYDIALIEQPVPADDWSGLKMLTQSLPAAIEADESAQSVQDVYRLVTDRVVDVVNLKVTKLGGLLRFTQAAALCQAGGVVCRVGAAFGPALMQAFAAHAASTLRALPYACELAEHQHLLGDPFEPLPVQDGMVRVPTSPGCGIGYAGAPDPH